MRSPPTIATRRSTTSRASTSAMTRSPGSSQSQVPIPRPPDKANCTRCSLGLLRGLGARDEDAADAIGSILVVDGTVAVRPIHLSAHAIERHQDTGSHARSRRPPAITCWFCGPTTSQSSSQTSRAGRPSEPGWRIEMSELRASDSRWPDLPERWRCAIELNATDDGHYGSTLELRLDGVLKCRMVMTRVGRDTRWRPIVAPRNERNGGLRNGQADMRTAFKTSWRWPARKSAPHQAIRTVRNSCPPPHMVATVNSALHGFGFVWGGDRSGDATRALQRR